MVGTQTVILIIIANYPNGIRVIIDALLNIGEQILKLNANRLSGSMKAMNDSMMVLLLLALLVVIWINRIVEY